MTSQSVPGGGKALRTAGIILFALATFFNLMGGVGTFCVATNPTRWGPDMAKLAPVQWLYLLLMAGATTFAIWGVIVAVGLARGRRNAYRNAVIVLGFSALLAGVQTFVSIALRGRGAPQNMRFYITAFTLAVFILLRLPPIWRLIRGFTGGGRGNWQTPAGLAAFAGGLVVLTTPLWATPTHIGPDGAQWVNVIRTPLLLGGALLTVGGAALVRRAGRVHRALTVSGTAWPHRPAVRG